MFIPVHKKNIRASVLVFATVLFLLLLPLSQTLAFDPFAMMANQIGLLIYGFATFLGGMVLTMGGLLFDISINHLVIGMGDRLLGTDGGASGIGTLVNDFWSIVRDVLNMLFIFGFIYIGIKTILNSEDSGTRKALGNLIIAALLINFSLYVTQVVVDVSNILSLQVYNQILDGGVAASGSLGTYEEGKFLKAGNNTISGAFLESAKMNSWFVDDGIEAVGSFGNIVVFSICMMFFLIITGIIFAYGAILIVSRFIGLILCMIFSPVMFLGLILPKFDKISKDWRERFFNYAFFAPIFLFLIYISYATMQILIQNVGEGATFASVLNGKEGQSMQIDSFIIILYFIIMIGFLYASIKVAQMMSIKGGVWATNGLKGMAKGIGGYASSQAIGWTSGKVAGKVNKWEENRGKPLPLVSQSVRSTLDKGKTSKFGGATSYKDRTDYLEKRGTEISRERAVTSIHDAIKTGTDAQATGDQKIAMERSVAKASNPQILKMAESEAGRKALKKAAVHLNADQMKAISGSDAITDDFKTELGIEKQKTTLQNLGIVAQAPTKQNPNPTPGVPSNINKATKEQLKFIEYKQLFDNAEFLQNSQLDDMKGMVDSGTISPTELDAIKKERERKINLMAQAPATAVKILKTRKGEKEIAKLPKEFLEHPNFAEAADQAGILNTQLLSKIATESEGVDKTVVGRNVRAKLSIRPGDGSTMGKWFDNGIGLQFVK